MSTTEDTFQCFNEGTIDTLSPSLLHSQAQKVLDDRHIKGRILFSMVSGSNAYDLATENSDVDLLAVYAAATESIYTTGKLKVTVDGHSPDYVIYEISHFLTLLSVGNPKIIEALFCRRMAYMSEEWNQLRVMSPLFLTEMVLDQYLGFAYNQMKVISKGTKTKRFYHIIRLLCEAQRVINGEYPSVQIMGEENTLLKDIRAEKYSMDELLVMGQAKLDEIDAQKPWDLPSNMDVRALEPYLYAIRANGYSKEYDHMNHKFDHMLFHDKADDADMELLNIALKDPLNEYKDENIAMALSKINNRILDEFGQRYNAEHAIHLYLMDLRTRSTEKTVTPKQNIPSLMRKSCDQWLAGVLPAGYTIHFVGVVGSQANNLARDTSDSDFLGVFQLPSKCFLSLTPQVDTVDGHGPDFSTYELGKFMGMLLNGNPRMLEMLFSEPGNMCYVSDAFLQLMEIRDSFISRKTVHNFVGYANSQIFKIEKGKEGSSTEANYGKKMYLALRLIKQALRIVTSEPLKVWFEDGDEEKDLLMTAKEGKMSYKELRAIYDDLHDQVTAYEPYDRLPSKPNFQELDEFLLNIRMNGL